MEHAITIRGLTKHYGPVPALTDLDLDVPAGSIFGFLGANGAGKTTAIKVIAGLSAPTRGSVEVMGVPASRREDYKRAIGYLGQEPRFYDWMTGRETLEYVAGFYPWVQDPLRQRVDELLDLVGIRDAADRRTATYSGGMRQRLGIAQALVGRPDVLLLDEPVSALDPIGRKDILELMERVRSHATVFYSTHILDDVQRVSDRVAILDHGRLVTTAPTHELLTSFTRGSLRVVLAGADERTRASIAAIPGVTDVRVESREGGLVAFAVQTDEGETARVQRAITRYAVDADLTLISNDEASLQLEDVFLRLIDPKERAA
jgi:ABC-2 type transport system ATP-binding protein